MEIPILSELALVFGLAVGVLLLFHRLRIPPVIGFLLTGVLAGPYGLGLVSAVHEVEVLAEIGVVLLLFTIGLELQPGELMKLGRPALIGGSAQVGITVGLFALIALLLGATPGQALFAGFLISMSSTAIVLRLLQASSQTESPQGRISLAILLFQDLAVVPMILLAPLLAGVSATSGGATPRSMLLGLLSVIAVFLIGRKLAPPLLYAVVRTRSREAFLLTTLALCLGIAFLTSHAGLSLALGAFLAGLIVASSPYSLSALQGVLPFRDVFTSLFFISVGMLLDARTLIHQPLMVLGGTLLLLSGKALIVSLIVLAFRYPLRTALLVGFGLAQVGEFAFVMARSGLKLQLLDDATYQLFLAASVTTMMLTPLGLALAPRLAALLARLPLPRAMREEPPDDTDAPREELHLLIIGFGLGGRHLARAARRARIPYRILEMNPVTVREEKERGEPIFHGDATSTDVLLHLGAAHARVMAIVVSDPVAIRRITEVALRVNPSLHLVVRTRFVSEVEPLRALGAHDVIAEEFETSVEVFTRVLSHCLVPHQEIANFTRKIRDEGYAVLRRQEPASTPVDNLMQRIPSVDVVGLVVAAGSALDGRSLAESDLRRAHGLTVVSARRAEQQYPGPDGSFRFEPGDIAWVFGDRAAIEAGQALFLAKPG